MKQHLVRVESVQRLSHVPPGEQVVQQFQMIRAWPAQTGQGFGQTVNDISIFQVGSSQSIVVFDTQKLEFIAVIDDVITAELPHNHIRFDHREEILQHHEFLEVSESSISIGKSFANFGQFHVIELFVRYEFAVCVRVPQNQNIWPV